MMNDREGNMLAELIKQISRLADETGRSADETQKYNEIMREDYASITNAIDEEELEFEALTDALIDYPVTGKPH